MLEHSGGNISYLGTEYTLTSLTDDAAVFTGTSRFEYEAGSITEKKITCRAVKPLPGGDSPCSDFLTNTGKGCRFRQPLLILRISFAGFYLWRVNLLTRDFMVLA